jgi:hypothetical protein
MDVLFAARIPCRNRLLAIQICFWVLLPDSLLSASLRRIAIRAPIHLETEIPCFGMPTVLTLTARQVICSTGATNLPGFRIYQLVGSSSWRLVAQPPRIDLNARRPVVPQEIPATHDPERIGATPPPSLSIEVPIARVA